MAVQGSGEVFGLPIKVVPFPPDKAMIVPPAGVYEQMAQEIYELQTKKNRGEAIDEERLGFLARHFVVMRP